MRMKKWWVLVACVLFAVSCLSIPAMAEQTHEPVELTMWVTSRNSDEAEDERKAAFLEAHPWITFNEVVKEGDPGNEFYQAVAAGTAPI